MAFTLLAHAVLGIIVIGLMTVVEKFISICSVWLGHGQVGHDIMVFGLIDAFRLLSHANH
jgi:hypothetical protein